MHFRGAPYGTDTESEACGTAVGRGADVGGARRNDRARQKERFFGPFNFLPLQTSLLI